MANPTRDPFEDLEKYRVQLEDNVTKLRKALQHWQTWEAEYEAFKEAVDELPADAEQEELVRCCGGQEVTMTGLTSFRVVSVQNSKANYSLKKV